MAYIAGIWKDRPGFGYRGTSPICALRDGAFCSCSFLLLGMHCLPMWQAFSSAAVVLFGSHLLYSRSGTIAVL